MGVGDGLERAPEKVWERVEEMILIASQRGICLIAVSKIQTLCLRTPGVFFTSFYCRHGEYEKEHNKFFSQTNCTIGLGFSPIENSAGDVHVCVHHLSAFLRRKQMWIITQILHSSTTKPVSLRVGTNQKKTRTEKDGGSWKCPDQKTLNSISFEKNLKWNVWIFVNKGRWMNYTLFLLLQFYFFSLSLFLFGRWFYRNAHWFVLGSFSLSFVDFVIKINTLCTDDLYILIFFRSFRCFNISSNRFFMAHQEGEWRERWMDDIDDENCAGNFSCFFFLRSLSLYISRHINRWIYIYVFDFFTLLYGHNFYADLAIFFPSTHSMCT